MGRPCNEFGELEDEGSAMTTPEPSTLSEQELKALEADCEVERMRLAACMTAALGNTRDAVEHRITRENPYWSAAYGDVCRAVDAEIALREERDALAAQLTELRQLRERAESDADEAIRGQLAAVKRAEAAEAQLTEVTRERDAIQATYDEFCAKFPSKSVMRREAARRA